MKVIKLQHIQFKFLAAVANSPMIMLHKDNLNNLMKDGRIKDDTDRTDHMRGYKNKMLSQLKESLSGQNGNDGQEITDAEIDQLISGVNGGYQLNLRKSQVHFYLEKGQEVPGEYRNLLPEWAADNHS